MRKRCTTKDRELLLALRGEVPMETAEEIVRRDRSAKPPETVPVTKELIHRRAVFAKAYVFLEDVRGVGTAISLWGVMSKLKISQPWSESPDKEYILEAAESLGMRIYEENGMTMLK